MTASIAQRLQDFGRALEAQLQPLGKTPQDITVVAVSKNQPENHIKQAYACGVRDFGENYVQEWLKKSSALAQDCPDIRWHLIGPLQKNKIKFLSPHIACLHTLNSLALAQELEKKWAFPTRLPVLVQLQVDPADTTKAGLPVDQAPALCQFLAQSSKHLAWQGFMGIGPQDADSSRLATLYQAFSNTCHRLWDCYNPHSSTPPTLSLGMSSDYALALQAGATLIRVGSALFPPRQPLL